MTLDPAFRPLARHDELVMNPSGADLLVYDQRSHHIHQLNPLSAAVWRGCSGDHTVFDLARLASFELSEPVSQEAVLLALRMLEEAGLLLTPVAPSVYSPRQSRRDLLRRAAITGTLAVPAIVSISAPHAAAATSTCPGGIFCNGACCYGGTCDGNGNCCPGGPVCNGQCCSGGACTPSGSCCPGGNICTSGECCPPGFCLPGGGCCGTGRICADGTCCNGGNCQGGVCVPF